MILTLKGFSLIELTIVLTLLGILSGVSALILEKAARSSLLHTTLNDMHWESRVAIERMAKEISFARSNSATDLVQGADSLTFTNSDNETITYNLSGTTLQRNDEDFVSNVSDLSFDYLDEDLAEIEGIEPSGPISVRYIRIKIEITDDGSVTTVQTIIF